MNIDRSVEIHLNKMFSTISSMSSRQFPPEGDLSAKLTAMGLAVGEGSMPKVVAERFSTASIDMWLRAVHSFLISASLTKVSPIWTSVAGYYSSHYSVRALAHALGFFHLFNAQMNVRLEFEGNRLKGKVEKKKSGDREHGVYWKVVKQSPQFASDPFFTLNLGDQDPSDVRHRNRANYLDHLASFPIFAPLDREALVERIQRISNMEISDPPIPRADRYPDLESVQVMAYHRLVKFRDLLDESLGDSNRFWAVHRDPPWARDFMNYQIPDSNSGNR